MTILPQNILKCMNPEDRKALGKGGLTAEEALAKAEVKNERDLQKQIVALLRLKGIEPIVSSMHKRTTNNLGTPDILFAVSGETEMYEEFMFTDSLPCAWEVKHGNGQLSVVQQQMQLRMTVAPNCWRFRTIRSVEEALSELRAMGIK